MSLLVNFDFAEVRHILLRHQQVRQVQQCMSRKHSLHLSTIEGDVHVMKSLPFFSAYEADPMLRRDPGRALPDAEELALKTLETLLKTP